MNKYICYAAVGIGGFLVGKLVTEYQVVMALAKGLAKKISDNDSKEDKS